VINERGDITATPRDIFLVNQYINKCEKHSHLLILLQHVCSGSVARGTELENVLLRNFSNDSVYLHRNLFYDHATKCIIFLANYNKHGIKLIPRFISGDMAKSFIIYTSIVRPALMLLNNLLKSNGKVLSIDDCCYSDLEVNMYYYYLDKHGNKLNDRQIREVISSTLYDYYDLTLSFSGFRQVRT